MRLAMRRTVGVGGATVAAIGAMLALALPASAHTPIITPACDKDSGHMTLTIDLTQYVKPKQDSGDENTVWATDTLADGTVIDLIPQSKPDTFDTEFHITFDANSTPAAGPNDVANTFEVKVTAWDAPDNPSFSPDFKKTVYPCVEKQSPPPPPPTKPTLPPSQSTPPAPTSTTTAVVAAASTTNAPPGAGELASTGVNAGVPLRIAGALVIIGGGILFFLRYKARRGNA
jgi:hypothetical protein